jgi:hypothetical protein
MIECRGPVRIGPVTDVTGKTTCIDTPDAQLEN